MATITYALLRMVLPGLTPVASKKCFCAVFDPSFLASISALPKAVPRRFLILYWAKPSAPMATRPARIEKLHGTVSSMMVEPARAPTPTCICCCASGPRPLKSIMAPSGTAPRMGNTTEPTMPAIEGTSSSSSEPSLSMLEAVKRM